MTNNKELLAKIFNRSNFDETNAQASDIKGVYVYRDAPTYCVIVLKNGHHTGAMHLDEFQEMEDCFTAKVESTEIVKAAKKANNVKLHEAVKGLPAEITPKFDWASSQVCFEADGEFIGSISKSAGNPLNQAWEYCLSSCAPYEKVATVKLALQIIVNNFRLKQARFEEYRFRMVTL